MADNIFTGATDNNWGTATNWSQGTVPTSSDGHITKFNASSPNCTVNASNRVCNSIDFTGYTNIITMTFNITVNGSITLESTMNVAGAGRLGANGTGNLTSDGYVWPNDFSVGGTSTTHTLLDNWSITGNLVYTGTGTTTVNGFQFTISAGINLTISGTTNAGTTNLILTGTGVWDTVTSTAVIRNNITINTAGVITIGGVSATISYNTGTLTYVAGTVVVNAVTFNVSGSVGMTTGNAIQFNNFTLGTSSSTMTLGADLHVTGTFSTGSSTSTTINGASYKMYVSGGLTISNSGSWGGTLGELILNGTGTITGTGNMRYNVTINTSGTITIGSTWDYRTGTLKYVAGTVDTTTNNSLLDISGSATLDTNGIIWNRVSFTTANSTITLSSNFTYTSTGTMGATTGTLTFNGNTVILNGNATLSSNTITTGNISGTSVFRFSGNNTVSMPSVTTGVFRNNWEINTTGTLTLSGTVQYNTGTITYTQGTIVGTLIIGTIATTITVNGAGMNLPGLITTGNTTFNGTHGCTIQSWTCTGAGLTHTFKAGNSYTLSTGIVCTATSASPKTIKSDSAGNQVTINLAQGATQDIAYVDVTDVNSSGGITLYSFKGVLSNATNWRQLTPPGTISTGFSF